MNNIPFVKISEPSRDLVNNVLGSFLVDSGIFLLDDVVKEAATAHVAGHNVDVFGVLERLDDSKNVRAIRDFVHKLDFGEVFLVTLENVIDLSFRNNLYCNFHLSGLMLRKVDLAERSFAKEAKERVLVETVLSTALGGQDMGAPELQILIAVKEDFALVSV